MERAMFYHEEWGGRSDWLKHADKKIELAEIANKTGLEPRLKYIQFRVNDFMKPEIRINISTFKKYPSLESKRKT